MNAENTERPVRSSVDSLVRPLIRVANTDGATLGLLREWLDAAGYAVLSDPPDRAQQHEHAVLTIVDVPFCRHGAGDVLRRISEQHPGTPILAMSATLFSTVSSNGACARRLGVAAVVPKPIARDKLLAAVDRLVQPAG